MSGISKFKRALGAYYAAQKEETENIYNYVIETLVDADFAQDYETAENMFEHMSSEFVAVILEEYIEEAKRSRTERRAANAGKKGYNKEGKPAPTGKPRVYDFDKVTADTTGTNVHIKNAEGKRVQSLNDTEFYTHHKNKELKPGHSYDYSDFDSPEVLAKNAKAIKSTISSMKRAQKRNKPVMTLTARSHKVKSGVTDFLNKHGVNASKVKQHFTGDMPSHLNTGERKSITLRHIVKHNPAGVKFTDDHPGNLEAAREVPKVKTILAKPNKRGEVVSRSYQATKNEEMTSYEYWKQFINEEEKKNDLEKQQELIDAGRQRLLQGNLDRQYLNKARRDFKSGKSTSLQRLSLYKAGGGDAAIAQGPTVNRNGINVTTMTKDDVIKKGLYATPQTQKPSSTEKKVVDATNIAGNKQKVTTNKNYGVTLSGHTGTATYGAGGERMIRANIGNAGVNQVKAGKAKVGQSYAAKLGGVQGTVKYDAQGNRSFQALQKPAAPKVK